METNVIETTETSAEIQRKAHFSGTVVKVSLAGAIIDIGVGIPGMVHISQLQKDPVNRVEDVLKVGQTVDVWVRRVSPKGDSIDLTMIEPLEMEWRDMKEGMAMKGKVVRLEKFGAFVDIGAERPGLVHVSELTHGFIKTPDEVVKEGEEVEVKILEVNRRKKQIRLSMKALEEAPVQLSRGSGGGGSRGKSKTYEIVDDSEADEPVPTAMEMALRQAMERTQPEAAPKSKRKNSRKDQDVEDLLSRTLANKRS